MPDTIREQTRQRLTGIEPRRIEQGYSRDAAVLMPIFERAGEPHFLLTLRTEEVETHKGQISFPGGMREGSEDLQTTALRETFEEVGIDGGSVDILGRFHDYLAVTLARVTPYVGYIAGPFTARPHPREVAAVLEVPFPVFRDPSHLRVERWLRRGEMTDVYFYTWGSHEIWGLTARIIHDFLRETEL